MDNNVSAAGVKVVPGAVTVSVVSIVWNIVVSSACEDVGAEPEPSTATTE